MIDPNQFDEYAESIVKAGDTIRDNFVSVSLAGLTVLSCLVGLVGYQERATLLPIIYKRLAKDTPAPNLATPWSQIPAEEYPEFFVCSKEEGCTPDPDKKEKIFQILRKVQAEIKADRVLFYVYSGEYRRLAAEVDSTGVKPLGQELWLVSVQNPGVLEPLKDHKNNICNRILIEELPEGGAVKIAALMYGTQILDSCPVIPELQVKGFISADFQTKEALDKKEIIQEHLKKAATEIEIVIWDK